MEFPLGLAPSDDVCLSQASLWLEMLIIQLQAPCLPEIHP